MRGLFFHLFTGSLWFFAIALPAPSAANGRKPAPIIREADFSGKPNLSLEDVAAAVNGQLHEYPVSKRVDLTFHLHEIQFSLESDKVSVDGQPATLGARPVKDDRGVWIPRTFFESGPLAGAFREKIDLGSFEPKLVPKIPSPPVGEGKGGGATPVKPTPHPAPSPTRGEGVLKEPPKPPAEVRETAAPPELPHAIRRIVIDPGHGGKDPGTVGGRGTEEKTVNLWMGQELADALREKDFEVLLTRTDDTFIPLRERAALANRYKADLFISVHCNASLSSKMNGFEVYILSEKASDPHAAAVARLENASLELEGKSPSAPVQAVLRSLVKNANINRSAQLGGIMDRQVGEQLSQNKTGLQQAAFYVLRGAVMPAILIELGFLSNKVEERHLEDPTYRKKLIQAIETSIVEFDKKQQEALKRQS